MNNPSTTTELSSFLKTLKRRRWIFLGTTIVTICAILVGHLARPIPEAPIPIFKSASKLLVTPPTPSIDDGTGESLQTWFASEQLLRQLVLSEEVLTRVKKSTDFPGEWQELRSAVTLAPSAEGHEWGDLWQSFLIDLSVEAEQPELSQLLANALVREFINYTQELAAREVIASRQLLERMARVNKKKIEDFQQKIVEWRKQNDVWDIDQLIEAQGQRIAELNSKREDKLQKLAELRQEITELDAYQEGRKENLPWEVVSLDSNLNQLAQARALEHQKLQKLRKLYTDQNSQVVEQLEAYQNSHNAYLKERRVLVNSLRQSRQAKAAEVLAVVRRIEGDLRALKNDKNLANSQVELEQLKRQLQSYQNNYEDLANQINTARVTEQKRRHLAAFTIVEKPLPGILTNPPEGSQGQVQIVLASLLIGVIVGGVTTITVDHFFLGVRLRPQVEAMLGLPVLGMLPRLDESLANDWAARGFEPTKRGKTKPGTGVLVHEEPNSLAAERFRSLIIQLMRLEEPPRRILVASCWPGEGKSLVCANLAAALTRFGVKVSLVDGDLRRPNLTHVFGVEGQPGFRQYLRDGVPAEELTVPVALKNVTFLPAGEGSENAAELLAEKRSLECLVGGDEDRFLLIDSPPLSVCSDSVLLSDETDGVLLVINSSHWDGQAEVEYVQSLEDHGIPILGLVLNGVHPSELSHGYLNRYQKYYTGPTKKTAEKPTLKA